MTTAQDLTAQTQSTTHKKTIKAYDIQKLLNSKLKVNLPPRAQIP